jgi:hypothetical protein
MTLSPEEKAKELYCKYRDALNIRDLQTNANPFAKQCAIIAVNEILNINSVDKDFSLSHYWLDVKNEIVNL